MRRSLIPLVLLLAACGDSPTDPPVSTGIVGDYALAEVDDAPLPRTIGWYTVQGATRSFRADGTFTGEIEVIYSTVEDGEAVHYPQTLAESGTWEQRSEGVYDLTVTQQHYRRNGTQDQRWTQTDTTSATVAGEWLTGGTLLYPNATLAFRR